MTDFSDRPFVAGSLFGVRSFLADNRRSLTGVVYALPWSAGVNEARCEPDWFYFGDREELGHSVATLGCKCGFYAYLDNEYNPHHRSGQVLGIVEGFGVATVGSRGFRASKARIVALVQPEGRVRIAISANPVFTLIVGDAEFSTIRSNYPDVPVFPTLDAALAEFPLTESAKSERIEPDLGAAPVMRYMTTNAVTAASAARSLRDAVRNLSEQMKGVTYQWTNLIDEASTETPRDRALRLRRERNTGPANTVGLDGHRRPS